MVVEATRPDLHDRKGGIEIGIVPCGIRKSFSFFSPRPACFPALVGPSHRLLAGTIIHRKGCTASLKEFKLNLLTLERDGDSITADTRYTAKRLLFIGLLACFYVTCTP